MKPHSRRQFVATGAAFAGAVATGIAANPRIKVAFLGTT
jgi:hypothetical protein